MNTIPQPLTDARRRRRLHSDEFKADAVTACLQPGVSMAAIAISRGINANLLRRWVRLAESSLEPCSQDRPTNAVTSMPASTFVPLQLPAPASPAPDIVIELRRGATTLTVKWPTNAAGQCAAWVREILR